MSSFTKHASRQEAIELLDWFEDNLLNTHDWLGTGSCKTTADSEEAEAREKWQRFRAVVKTGYWGMRV